MTAIPVMAGIPVIPGIPAPGTGSYVYAMEYNPYILHQAYVG